MFIELSIGLPGEMGQVRCGLTEKWDKSKEKLKG